MNDLGNKMKNKSVSLFDMIKLSNNEKMSEQYIRYICGIETDRQYKHQEVMGIQCLLETVTVDIEKSNGFIYGYRAGI